MERTKNIVIVLLAALCCLMVYLNLTNRSLRHTEPNEVVSDTTRVVVADTIKFFKVVPRDSTVVRYITERLPVADTTAHLICEASNPAPDTNVGSNSPADSIEVVIPIISKRYHGEDYDAWVSGHKPSLDSIFVYPKRETITITNTERIKRWSIGIHAGYGITPHGPEPYIGIGISYSLFRF